VKGGNGWTGGQFSLFRATLGAYLAVHFVQLIPWGTELFSNRGMLPDASLSPLAHAFPNLLDVLDSPAAVTAVLILAALASLTFAAGAFPRIAAVTIWYFWACLLGRNPLISNPGIPFVGWILLATLAIPSAPYGSWKARGRTDPAGGWEFPQPVFVAAWILMALAYSYSGSTKLVSPSWIDGSALGRVLANPLARTGLLRQALLALPPLPLRLATWGVLALELLYAPLAMFRAARRWIWSAMVLVHCGLLMVVDFADLTAGMLMIHFLTFDPAWIPGRAARAPEWVFFDGSCGLCHGFVRFALAEDRSGAAFRFAPLHGQTFRESVPSTTRLPDSLVVLTADGDLRTRSNAVLYLLQRLGGLWRALALVLTVVPPVLRDAAYDGVARLRHAILPPPADVCPLVPPVLRERIAP
jgi:predicted DCC family thiol-disulfide oxidoreductase YuxK